jgi:hypothetical protein
MLKPRLVGTIGGLADPSADTWPNDITPPTLVLIPSETQREATNRTSSPRPRPSSSPGDSPQSLPEDTREVTFDAGGVILESNILAYDNPTLDRFHIEDLSLGATQGQKHDFHREVTSSSNPEAGDEKMKGGCFCSLMLRPMSI